MNEQPRPIQAPESPKDSLLQGYQQRSFIFGLVSIVTCAWLAPVGLGFGIAGLVQTRKARRRSVELQENPPRQFMPQFVLSLLGTIGASVAMVLFAITVLASLSTLGPIINGLFTASSEYPKAVATLEAAKKDFSADETVEFGPFDMTIRDVQKGYAPTSEEVSQPREGVVYTKFTADVSYNAERGATYDRLMMDVRGWGDGLGWMELDGTRCGTYPTPKELEKYNAKYKDDYMDSTTITYLCAGTADGEGKLTMEVSLFSRVSSIVGTEGMSRKYVTYSVQL